MTRLDRTTAAGLWVAQQARKEARAADHAYLTTPATRWQTGGNVSFDVPIAQPSTSGGVDGHAADVSTEARTGSQCGIAAASRVSVVKSKSAVLPLARTVSQPAAGVESGPLTHQRAKVDAVPLRDNRGCDKQTGIPAPCRAAAASSPLAQRPAAADCRTDQPSPAVPSVAAVGAPLYATGADAPTSNGGAASLAGRPSSAAGAPLYALVHYCRAAGLPEPVPEYRFHPTRMWRFDYAFPLHKIAVEVDGGVWTQGRHTRGAGYIADMEKMNAAAKLGWRVLKYTPQTLGVAIDDLRVVLT